MTDMQVAGVYVAANILLLVYLAFRVVQRRFRDKISIGDGGDKDLALAIRVHGNASEYVPAAMIGLIVLVMLHAGSLLIHICGGAFTAGRLLHAFGFSRSVLPSRQLGVVLTWLSMLAIAGVILWKAFTPVA